MDTKWIDFNVNHNIKVKLKDSSYSYWCKKHNEIMPLQMIKPLKFFTDKTDSDGYVTFQMWEFMQIFGELFRMGSNNPCELNIKINISE